MPAVSNIVVAQAQRSKCSVALQRPCNRNRTAVSNVVVVQGQPCKRSVVLQHPCKSSSTAVSNVVVVKVQGQPVLPMQI